MRRKEIMRNNVLGVYESIVEEGGGKKPPELQYIYDTVYLELMDDLIEEVEARFGDDYVTNERLEILGLDSCEIPTIFEIKEVLDGQNLPYLYEGKLHNSFQLRFY